MGSKIYTRTGDFGETSLSNGRRVPKDAERVETYGALDETNSWVGLARAFVEDSLLSETLEFLQHRLYNCASNIATPGDAPLDPPGLSAQDIATLERAIDRFEEKSGSLTRFILPGGTPAASFLHVARTVCRRAERRLISLARQEPVDELVRKFVNRCSDFLFAAARYANAVTGRGDLPWDRNLPRPGV